MGLRRHDLVDMLLGKISIDEFEPKTGKVEDVVVVGFFTKDQQAGHDLYSFLNAGTTDHRDIEVSPNPDSENHYMVFIEFARHPGILEQLKDLIKDIENVSGPMKWAATTHLTSRYFSLSDPELKKYLITEPEKYMSRKEFVQAKKEAKAQTIKDHFQKAGLEDVVVEGDRVTFGGTKNHATLEIVSFGPNLEVMEALGLSRHALTEHSRTMGLFNKLLGPHHYAVEINNHIVIYNHQSDNILVTKLCSDS